MVLIKDFSKDFTNPRARSARREGAKRPMRAQFSKLRVFVKIMPRAKRGREAPDALLRILVRILLILAREARDERARSARCDLNFQN